MIHPKREEWIPFLFGESDAETKQRLEAHLNSCATCGESVAGWRRSVRRLDAWKLPKAKKAPQSRSMLPLAWAAAAALVIGAFIAGRLTGRSGDAQKLRAELKAEISTQIQSGFAQMSSASSNALADLEVRLAAMSVRNNKQMAQEFVRVIDTLRSEDREATEALFVKLQKQYTSDFVLLRRDLETLASTTDEEIESARLKLYQLASNQNP